MTIRRRTALLALAASLVGAPQIAEAATAVITGTVTYRERIALPPNARVEVKLVDVSRADAPSQTLAATTVRVRGQVPIAYRLRVNRAAIRPGHTYALQARILVNGQMMFTTTTRHSVFGTGPDQTDILVQRVASAPETGPASAGAGPAGRWLAEDIMGGGVIDRLQTVLELGADGTVSGTGGCNRMNGRATISGSSIAFGNIASTMMACTPAAMTQERRFFDALGKAKAWQADPTRRKLRLSDASGNTLVVFTRM